MILKNSSISTENPTPILRCRIALRLRCAICILIFSICILSVRDSCAQVFSVETNGNFYTGASGSVIPPTESSDLSVLKFTISPYNSSTVVDADIIPNFIRVGGIMSGNYGWFEQQTEQEPTSRTWYVVVSADTMYVSVHAPNSRVLSTLQDCLIRKNLGTVDQRRFLISTYNGQIISPYDFRAYLQPWIIVGLVIAILIPAWYLCRRFLRG